MKTLRLLEPIPTMWKTLFALFPKGTGHLLPEVMEKTRASRSAAFVRLKKLHNLGFVEFEKAPKEPARGRPVYLFKAAVDLEDLRKIAMAESNALFNEMPVIESLRALGYSRNQACIFNFLLDHPHETFSSVDITRKCGTTGHTISMVLGEWAALGWLASKKEGYTLIKSPEEIKKGLVEYRYFMQLEEYLHFKEMGENGPYETPLKDQIWANVTNIRQYS